MNKIKAIFGMEPRREGEFPMAYIAGDGNVASILRREENLGSYGITWFDIVGDGENIIVSVNALAVSEIHYAIASDKTEG